MGSVVDHPWVAILFVVALTGLSTLGYRDPHFFEKWISTDNAVLTEDEQTSNAAPTQQRRRAAVTVDPIRLMDADSMLLIQSDNFFTTSGVRAMRRIVERLEALDYVQSVMWMDRVPIMNIFGLPEPILPRGDGSNALLQASKRKALAHPLVLGQFLSADAKSQLLLVRVEWLFVTEDSDVTTRLIDVARQAIAEEPKFQAEVQVTGRVPLYLDARASHDDNQLRYQLVGYGVIFITALVLFRGPSAVLIVALAPALGVFWTLGILRFFDLQDNPFNDVILPTLLSLVGLTDGVHMMIQIRHHRAAGMAPKDAARLGAREVGVACFLTSLTTAIGLGSLGLARHEIVKEFGWCCVIGVGMTLISVLIVIPLACSTFLGRGIHRGHHTGMIQKHLTKIGVIVDWSVRWKKSVSALAIGSTLLFGAIALRLQPDERNQTGLPEGSASVQAIRAMDVAFGGLERGAVDIRWNADVPDGSETILRVLQEVDEALRREQLIGHPLSLATLVAALPGSGADGGRLAMADLLPPPLKFAFYNPEEAYANVSFRVQDIGIAKYAPVFERLETSLAEIAAKHPGFTLEMSGSAVRRWRDLFRIVTDLATSLGTASVIIFIVLTIAYRSLRIGLISIVPNVFPLAITGAIMVYLGQSLEMVSVCAFTICLGIAVDDTIHFMTRHLECTSETKHLERAVHRAFVSVGTALITTTVVLVAGFATVLWSDSREHLIFAWMGISTFLSALFADLFFLPALLVQFGPKPPQGDN